MEVDFQCFLLFTASVWSRQPGPTLFPGVFYISIFSFCSFCTFPLIVLSRSLIIIKYLIIIFMVKWCLMFHPTVRILIITGNKMTCFLPSSPYIIAIRSKTIFVSNFQLPRLVFNSRSLLSAATTISSMSYDHDHGIGGFHLQKTQAANHTVLVQAFTWPLLTLAFTLLHSLFLSSPLNAFHPLREYPRS